MGNEMNGVISITMLLYTLRQPEIECLEPEVKSGPSLKRIFTLKSMICRFQPL